jgi:hypothetical protein
MMQIRQYAQLQLDRIRPLRYRRSRYADVAELVDARDLKSLDFGHTGSIPVVRTR